MSLHVNAVFLIHACLSFPFLPTQCCIVAFLLLTETKLKCWTVKYGREEKVAAIMAQYKTFVSKNKIFQEFHKAFVEFQEVCHEYKKDGNIGEGGGRKLGEVESGDRH